MRGRNEIDIETAARVKLSLSKLDVKIPSPSPFMAARLMSQFRAEISAESSRHIWKTIAAFSFCSAALITAAIWFPQPVRPSQGLAENSYVIHLSISPNELTNLAAAEISLPAGVHFVSELHHDLKNQKTLKLPFYATKSGKTKLPFVVSAHGAGNETLKIRLFDHHQNVLKDSEVKIHFAKNQSPTAL